MANIMKRNNGNRGELTTTSPAMTFGGLVDLMKWMLLPRV